MPTALVIEAHQLSGHPVVRHDCGGRRDESHAQRVTPSEQTRRFHGQIVKARSIPSCRRWLNGAQRHAAIFVSTGRR
jgi:hypothetical protein